MDSLADIIKIGAKVTPIIYKTLKESSSPRFRSPVYYHFETGGKRMRATLVLLGCLACSGNVENAMKPAALVEMIHNYSLVMDDLIDRGLVRRGQPTVRVRYGDSTALLIAMLYREALDNIITECIQPEIMRGVAVQAMKDIIEGERLDLTFEQAGRLDPYLRTERVVNPSFQLYLRMIGKKTAALFKAASQMGAIAARAREETVEQFGEFGWKAGLAFQIMDDVLDICGGGTGKEVGKDIIEHKLGNAVVLTSIKYLPPGKRARVLKTLRTEKASKSQITDTRRLIMETPAEKDCREIAAEYLLEAKSHLSILRGTVYKNEIEKLSEAIVTRTF